MENETCISTVKSDPELIVIFKPGVEVRNTVKGLVSQTFDVSPLHDVLNEHGATFQLLFGKSEDRMRQQQRDLAVTDDVVGVMPDMARFYRVLAPVEKLEELAKGLKQNGGVEAAYVKPGGSDPVFKRSFQPLDDPAPAVTPNYVDRQGYLKAAPGGIDAIWAWTVPGGGGTGLRVIDCERLAVHS